MVTIFSTMLTYCTDCYTHVSGSAMAANAVTRSVMAAAFPLFVPKMYSSLSTEMAQTVLGCIAVAFAPVPFLFWKYGAALRKRGKYATKEEDLTNS